MISATSTWRAITPVVFRILERCWVDKFFETGELRLSSFAKFREHTDEQRKDNEGANIITLRGESTTAFAVLGHGYDAYILCATSLEPSQSILQRFSCDAAIQVFDTMAFANALSSYVTGFRGGYAGHCAYTARSIQVKVKDVDIDSFRTYPGSNDIDANKAGMYFLNAAGAAVYFRKAATPTFIEQAEYRWVFLTSGDAQQTITIRAPEARQFCLPWYPASER